MKKFLLYFFCFVFILSNVATAAFTISGKVTSEDGRPLIAVNVFEVGVNNQVQTNAKGEYSITVQYGTAIIRFSYAGYQMQELKAANTFTRNIVLKIAAPENPLLPVTSTYSSLLSEADLNGTEATTGLPLKGNEAKENPFKKTAAVPVSSFSVNVDGPSYSHIYRFGQNAEMPSERMVRIEEMVNYFHYNYPRPHPDSAHPFSITTELSQCPWSKQHKLLLVALQGKEIETEKLPSSNLIFLVDISGSMAEAVKLPLVKASLKLLAQQLRNQDRVTVVTYAGNAKLALPPTYGNNKATIENAVDALQPGGYTAGSAGIKLAYKTAKETFIKNGNNRIVLCTDGDFNVGITNDRAVDSLIEVERKSGVFLSVLGFGTGRLQNAKMRRWAEKGNGNHNFISGLNEARRLFINEYASTLFAIAKDVRPLARFNPDKVQAYRLIGYDTKPTSKTAFESNGLDEAGTLGSGHTVTALYEIIPVGIKDKYTDELGDKDFLRPLATGTGGSELANIEFRYKKPEEETLRHVDINVKDETVLLPQTSANYRFAASVAEFGLLLRDSEYKQKATYKDVISLAKTALENDASRKEFVTLAENMQRVARLMR